MTPVGLQLWTMRDEAARDFAAVLHRVAAMGYDGVETAGLHGMQPSEFRSRIDDLGLELIGHFSVLPCLSEMEHALRDPERIGSRYVIAGLDEDDCRTVDGVKRGAERLNRFAQLALDRGITLGYHNHWWEFAGPGGWRPFSVLLDELDPGIFLEVDIYWMQTAGVDAAAELRWLAERVKRLHVKDGPLPAEEFQSAVGEGALDVPAILAEVPQADWHVVEMDSYDGDLFKAIRASHRYLSDLPDVPC